MIWRPIPGFPDYYVSLDGQVASGKSGKTLKPQVVRGGYLAVGLYRNGKQYSKYVHHLVLEGFRGPALAGMEALHADDQPANNWLGNLSWGTRSQNAQDCLHKGRHPIASRPTCAKGHAYTNENTLVLPNGRRKCRECHRRNCRAYYKRKRETK